MVVEIVTDHLHLTYRATGGGFSSNNFQIRLLESGKIWHYGDTDNNNLGGTIRTLDGIDGAIPIPPGLMSRNGWSVIDDSTSLVFNDSGWLESRTNLPESKDIYFFGYGNDYRRCLQDFCQTSGSIPLIPRWMLGNWWSKYCAYSQDELKNLMNDFLSHEIPLSVCIIDMDWHIVRNEYNRGWTGYTWNKELFPDVKGFIAWLHNQGIRTALNLHPRDGVYPHEEMYEQFASEMGVDPSGKQPIEFDISDPEFVDCYFRLLHHPHEKLGVDFWWMDWQQGTSCKTEGLDPLWWLNHYHFYDLGRDGKTRPIVFSRWGNWGSHRYPIGFSGDTLVTWESLAFQPHLTATASNAGYTYWSHDIGGHFHGMEDPELYVRWIQFGVFSPILRLHSSKCRYQDRRPWAYDAETLRIAKEYMQLRHAFIPYIYTMNYKTYSESLPLVRSMYFDYPESEEAYSCPNQYLFGTELIVAPYTSPKDPDTRMARQSVWLPEGDWYNFFTGECHAGGRFMSNYGKLDQIPVFARAGAIVPLGPRFSQNTKNPDTMEVHVFAGNSSRFELYEDDGTTVGYQNGAYCVTEMKQEWSENQLKFYIEPASGATSLIPQKRIWTIVVSGIRHPETLKCSANDRECTYATSYDHNDERLTLKLEPISTEYGIAITLEHTEMLRSRRNRILEHCDTLVESFRLYNDCKMIYRGLREDLRKDPETIQELIGYFSASQIRALCEVATGAGYEYILQPEREVVVIWNPDHSPHAKYTFNNQQFGNRDRTTIPRFLRFEKGDWQAECVVRLPDRMRWQISIYLCGITIDSFGRERYRNRNCFFRNEQRSSYRLG